MNRRITVSFHTLGCKLNQAETESLSRQFTAAGYVITAGAADISVINTCTVTHVADRKSRHLIRIIKKAKKDTFVIATGCCVERAPDSFINAGADMVVNNDKKTDILKLVQNCHGVVPASSRKVVNDGKRIRSFVKIQHGCSNGCSYCIVPSVRGHERSLPAADIIKEINMRTADGYKEVVLTGTRIGSYDDNGTHLADLLTRILSETDLPRLHLSSLQPQQIDDHLLSLWHNKRLCRHFHLALQSGSDSVLQRMRRKYTAGAFKEAIANIRSIIPDSSITTDVIVGFPGESDSEFEETIRLCRDTGFAAVHVFMFSPRPGTAAALMKGFIDATVKKQRSLQMLALARESANTFHSRFIGQIRSVLWESETKPGAGLFAGLTDNYIRVFTQSHAPLHNRLLPTKLVSVTRGGIKGELTS